MMSVKNKMKNFFGLDDEQMDAVQIPVQDPSPVMETPEESPYANNRGKTEPVNNLVAIHSKKKERAKVILAEPRVFAEAQDIGDHLKDNRAVIVNLQRMSKEQSRHVVNFLSGVIYAIDGSMTNIGQNTILCTPSTVELTGSISTLISEDDLTSKGW